MPKRISKADFNKLNPPSWAYMAALPSEFSGLPKGLVIWYFQSIPLGAVVPHIKLTRGPIYGPSTYGRHTFISLRLTGGYLGGKLKLTGSERLAITEFLATNAFRFEALMTNPDADEVKLIMPMKVRNEIN